MCRMENNLQRMFSEPVTRLQSPMSAAYSDISAPFIPEHAAHEQQMLRDLCWVEEGGAVRAQAGQESPGSPGAVFAGPAQPQAP